MPSESHLRILLLPIFNLPYVGATNLLLDWNIDAGDSVSGQERAVGPYQLSPITVPDVLLVS
jgi:hypothetical protein